MNGIPIMGDGFWADVEAGQYHLRLFAEVYELGHVATVYDMKGHRELGRNDADNLDAAKQQAEQLAADYLRHLNGTDLPPVNWQMNAVRQRQQQQQQ